MSSDRLTFHTLNYRLQLAGLLQGVPGALPMRSYTPYHSSSSWNTVAGRKQGKTYLSISLPPTTPWRIPYTPNRFVRRNKGLQGKRYRRIALLHCSINTNTVLSYVNSKQIIYKTQCLYDMWLKNSLISLDSTAISISLSDDWLISSFFPFQIQFF